ncbi:MAG TPA: hypothetical protein VLM38_14445 [Blastocatellia bacterium]|nr:hypothetical protein [Blastocatellia bacterium]
MKLHTTDKSGPLEASYELQTNDPKHPVIKVTVVANVKPVPAYVKRITTADIARGEENGAFQIWPTARPAITLEAGERLALSLRIRPLAASAGSLTLGPNAPDSWKLRREANEYWLDISLDGSNSAGSRTVPLLVELPGGRSREIRVQLMMNVPAESIVATPRDLDFGEVTLETAKSTLKRLGIRKIVGSFHVKSLSSTLPFLKLEQTEIVPGSNYLIRVTVDQTKPLKPGDHAGVILIETDDGHRVEVPVKLKLADR